MVTHVFGQNKSGENSLLFSNGKNPEFLEKHTSRFFIPQDSPWIKGIKKDKKAFYLDQLYASNMIVYGDPVSNYSTELLKNITSEDYSVYLVRSNSVATFSDSLNIFVTSGLISRLSNEAQLMFFLAREVEILKGEYQPLFTKTESKISLGNTINELSIYSEEDEIKLDQQAYNLVKSKKLYSETEILSAFDVLKFQNRPFYEHSFDIQYFNNEFTYIPESKFFLLQKKNPKEYDFEKEFPSLVNRINQLSKNNELPSTFTFLNAVDDFKNIVHIARQESIVLNILEANFSNAIYEVYVLEKLGYSSAFLDKLKASSWWGYVNQIVGNIQTEQYNAYEISDSKGAVFMRFLSMQSREAQITLGLRTLKDLTDAYPESKAISRMFDDLVSVASKSSEFKLETFQETGLLSEIKNVQVKDSLDKRDQAFLDAASQELKSKGVDSANYHLFIIPDLVKSESFQEKYKMYKLDSVQEMNVYPSSIAMTDFSLVKFKKKKLVAINENDKKEIVQGAYSIANKETSIAINEFNSSDSYNFNYLVNTVFIQNYHFNNYSESVNSIFSDEIANQLTSASSEIVGISIYEHAYEPTYRSFYLIGLFGVTLPYVIPEFFYSGNKAIFSSLYFDASNGTTKGLIYHRINDPFNERIIQNSFLESILITFPKND